MESGGLEDRREGGALILFSGALSRSGNDVGNFEEHSRSRRRVEKLLQRRHGCLCRIVAERGFGATRSFRPPQLNHLDLGIEGTSRTAKTNRDRS